LLETCVPTTGWPHTAISPRVCMPGGKVPMMACARIDLPEPDSPRIVSRSPAASTRLTPRTMPAPDGCPVAVTCRLLISRASVIRVLSGVLFGR